MVPVLPTEGPLFRPPWRRGAGSGCPQQRVPNDMPIHSTAVICSEAQVDPTADIGPYVVIDGPVRIGPRVRVYPHAYLTGWTELAEDVEIHPHTAIGHLPQDFHFTGERSYCKIGRGTVIREGVSVHRAAQAEQSTVVGEHCLLLSSSHVAHDVVLADRVTLISYAAIAGHVHVGERAILSAHTAVHQFCRIGTLAILSGGGLATRDIPPFMTMVDRNRCAGVNVVGMRRASLPSEDIDEMRWLHRRVYRTMGTLGRALEEVREQVQTPSGRTFLEFFDSPSRRGVAGPVRREKRHQND
jgi:UDP-N-acetylglucosamine acyltransferase